MITIEHFSKKELERRERVEEIKRKPLSPQAVRKIIDRAKANNQNREEEHTQSILDKAANAKRPGAIALTRF